MALTWNVSNLIDSTLVVLMLIFVEIRIFIISSTIFAKIVALGDFDFSVRFLRGLGLYWLYGWHRILITTNTY